MKHQGLDHEACAAAALRGSDAAWEHALSMVAAQQGVDTQALLAAVKLMKDQQAQEKQARTRENN